MAKHVGTLTKLLVAKSVLVTVREQWKLIFQSQDKQTEIRWSAPLAQIATVNYVSGTYAITQLNQETHFIKSVDVRWIDTEQVCEDGHWHRLHAELGRIGRKKVTK